MTDKELYQQMLHFIECSGYRAEPIKKELKIRLAQPEPEPEPVAWINKDLLQLDHIIKAPIQVCRRKQDEHYNIPLYTAPPKPTKLITVGNILEQAGYVKKKEWVGLTDDEIKNSMQGHNTQVDFARAIEAKLKEKNT